MPKPLPMIEIQRVIHYAMPYIKLPRLIGRHTICSISTGIPGFRVPVKDNTVNCRACKAIAAQVRNHS